MKILKLGGMRTGVVHLGKFWHTAKDGTDLYQPACQRTSFRNVTCLLPVASNVDRVTCLKCLGKLPPGGHLAESV